MNKRVLKYIIGLLWFMLISFCILKLFFPQQLLLCIENEKVVYIGKFIDTHSWLRVLINFFVSMLTAHFYLCACKQSWKLPWFVYFMIAPYFLLINVFYIWNGLVSMILDIAALIVFPIILKSKYKQFIPIFILHMIGQYCLLFIRSSELYISNVNYASTLLLVFDVYLWLLIYYLHSNLNKEVTLWESVSFRFSAILQKLSLRRNLKK